MLGWGLCFVIVSNGKQILWTSQHRTIAGGTVARVDPSSLWVVTGGPNPGQALPNSQAGLTSIISPGVPL